MANNRDVKLTIKAKDEASAVIAKVAEALNKYGKGSDDLSKKISPIGDKFKRLTTEVTALQSTLTKSKGQIAVAGQYKILSDTLSKVATDHKVATAAIAENSAKLSEAKTRLDAVTNARDASRKSLAANKDALQEATRAAEKNTTGLAKATEASSKYSAELAKRESQLAGYKDDLNRANAAQEQARQSDERAARTAAVLKERLADLRAEREAQRKALTTGGMTARTESAGRLAAKTQDPSDALTARRYAEEEGAARSRLVAYDSEIARVGALADAADAVRAKTRTALNATAADVRTIQADMVKVDNTASLGRKLAEANSEVNKLTTGLDKANSEVARLSVAVDTGTADLQQYSAATKTTSDQVQHLEAESKKLNSTINSSSSTMDAVSAAMTEMNANAKANGFSKLDSDIGALEKSLLRIEERLKETTDLSNRLAKYSDGAGGFANANDASKLRNLNAQLTQSTEDAKRFRQEIIRLQTGLSGAGRNSKETKSEIKNLSQAISAAESDARKFRTELKAMETQSGRMKTAFSAPWDAHNRSGRTALTIQQRLQSQVIALITAYGGLYGVAAAVRSVSEAYMQQEAAVSRLGVVFSGNSERIGVELGWIRREAQRLGIEFGTLSDEYTKFAVSGKTSGFSETAIRTIFTSVSEAARVNKLGLEDIKGVYLALSQMISKGKISAEELRQQLGERLPGAMALMAKALGVTVAQLDDMMKKGQALSSEENMLKFAQTLKDQFGSQLPASLRSFTTEWGRLQNTIYSSKLLVGQGGLMAGLTEAMRKINEYASSSEGVSFFLAIGDAMGKMAQWIPYILENFDKFVTVFKAILLIPIIGFFNKAIASITLFGGSILTAMTRVAAAPYALGRMTGAMAATTSMGGRMIIMLRGIGAALMTLGPLMAGIAVAGYIFNSVDSWSEGVDDLVELQAQHARIMDSILAKYEEAKGKTYSWKDAIEEKNKTELAQSLTPNIEAFKKEMNDFLSKYSSDLLGAGKNSGSYMIEQLESFGVSKSLRDELKSAISSPNVALPEFNTDQLSRLSTALKQVSEQVPDRNFRDRLVATADGIDKLVKQGGNVASIVTVMKELGFSIGDDEKYITQFGRSMKEMADGVSDGNSKISETDKTIRDSFIKPLQDAISKGSDFKEGVEGLDLNRTISGPFDDGQTSITEMLSALGTLKAFMPQLQAAFQKFAKDGSLSDLEESLSWMKRIPELKAILDKFMTGAYSSAMGEKLKDYKNFGEIMKSGTGWLIRANEGMRNTAYADQKETGGFSAWRVGYGSDTITDPATGKYRTTQQGDKITNAEAEADLARRIITYITDIVSKVGKEQWDSLSGDQQEVLLSLAHNYGSVPDKIIEAVRSGTKNDVANAIRGEIRDGSVNNERRREEAEIYARGGDSDKGKNPFVESAEKRMTEAEKEAKAKADENKEIADGIRLEQMRVDGKEREAFIQEKINAYTSKHGELSQEELKSLTEQYGKMYDLQNLKSKDEQTQEAIKKHNEEINRLESERNALMEQRESAASKGDVENVKALDAQLAGVNAKLTAAIDAFVEFWKASDSPDAAAGIAQAQALKQKISEVSKTVLLTADEINQKWAAGVTDAFSSFAEAIANGENALSSFRDSFLKFVGEFLIEIGKMIIQQTILNVLENGEGTGGGFGAKTMGILSSITTGVFHTGKGAGATSNGMSRTVSPSLFANAPRFHSGKLPGLRTGEMAAIIEQDEEVIPTTDPRHAWNQGQSGGKGTAPADAGITMVNAFDAESFLSAGLASPNGRKLFMNFVKANKASIKGALG